MTDSEDRRAAVNIKMSVAPNLTLAALAFIGAEGGIGVFVLDKRQHLLFFYLVGVAAVLALTLSVVFGGLGIRKAYQDGYQGNWGLSDRGRFHYQALCCLVGAGLVLVSSVLGTPKAEPQQPDLHVTPCSDSGEVQKQIEKLSLDLEAVKKNLENLKSTNQKRSARNPPRPAKKSDQH